MAHLSFQAIRRHYGISISQIADSAGVEPREAYLFEIGVRINQQRAERIVRALNTLTGEHYRLTDFTPAVSEQPTRPVPIAPKIRRATWLIPHG